MSSTCLAEHVPCLSVRVCLSWHHSANQCKYIEAARNSSTSPEGFWCISLYEMKSNEDQWRPAKTSEALHDIEISEPLGLCGVPFIFFPNIALPLECLFSAKHHEPSHKTASRRTSCDTTEFFIKQKQKTNKQKTQKFLLHCMQFFFCVPWNFVEIYISYGASREWAECLCLGFCWLGP